MATNLIELCSKGWNAISSLLRNSTSMYCMTCKNSFSLSIRDPTPLQLMFCSFSCYVGFARNQRINENTCLLPGCERTRGFNHFDKVLYDYCSRTHAQHHDQWLHILYHHGDCSDSTKSFTSLKYFIGKNQPIFFYDKDEPFYEFTNFAIYPINVDGRFYQSTEHYFQSQKLVGTPYEHYIAMLPRARDAFEFSRKSSIAKWVRRDWASVKEDVMLKGLYCKFTQYPTLKRLLLETGDRRLVEDSPHDSYWGIGRDRNGQNRLGELLMRLRGALRNHQHTTSVSTDGSNNVIPADSTDQHSSKYDMSSSGDSNGNNLDNDDVNYSGNHGDGRVVNGGNSGDNGGNNGDNGGNNGDNGGKNGDNGGSNGDNDDTNSDSGGNSGHSGNGGRNNGNDNNGDVRGDSDGGVIIGGVNDNNVFDIGNHDNDSGNHGSNEIGDKMADSGNHGNGQGNCGNSDTGVVPVSGISHSNDNSSQAGENDVTVPSVSQSKECDSNDSNSMEY